MVTYGVRLGDALIARYPDLDLQRPCDDCLQLRVALNAVRPGDDSGLPEISRRIVRNANRHALLKFGRTRNEQQTAIAALLSATLNGVPSFSCD
ncbi:hypothetical protein Poly24_08970 [Rosistilla carotiformis]|uniref:Uncharacterized protein n=2 Tax=Rosistilla carotiformis TaxID=2528017 RepID=A0A518JNS8_9BACT|nr:hypothetical protein Poly24_08970 [Rosistilla carotiformis]